ncbi:MAG: hypothetical protein KF763_11755 [Cyclobacteriaceae bacterium]|nr:hypothetical protein [Cyclobacteriaceae bacterium]
MKYYLLPIAFLICLPFAAYAQGSHWLIPDHVTIQFAGSMGLVAGGFGYANESNRMHLDLLMGYVPKQYSYNQLGVASLKYTQVIWRSRLLPEPWSLTPLTGGAYLTYTFGKNFRWPEHYAKGYYWWSESLRPNVFLGGNVSKKFDSTYSFSRITFYYEVGTNELKLTSYYVNPDMISPLQILHAGLGLRFSFR